MKRENVFIKNTVMQYLMTIVKYIFPFFLLPYLTRILKPEIYGIVVYITAVINYFQIFIDFGFDFSSTKKIAENKKDKRYVEKIVANTIIARTVLFLLSLVIYSLCIFNIQVLYENMFLSYLYIIPVGLNILLPDFLFRGIEKMEIITYRYIVSKTISTITTFIFVRTQDDVLLIPILNSIGTIAAIILTWSQVKKVYSIKLKDCTYARVKQELKASYVYFFSTFATTAYSALNTLALGVMNLPEKEIAFWGIAYNLISAAQSLYSPITNSLYPHMVSTNNFNLTKKILKVFMPLIIICVCGLMFFAKYVILIFGGKEYEGAIIVFRLLAPMLIFSFPAVVLGFPTLGVLGKEKETTLTTVFSSVFHILGLIFLIFINKFSIFTVAILRTCTEAALCLSRVGILLNMKGGKKP